MSKLGVLFVHGMGSQGPDYASRMESELRGRIARAGTDPQQIVFTSAYWGDLLNAREDNLLRRMDAQADLDWLRLRREVVVGGLGDAIAYLGTANTESIYYRAIHGRLEAALRGLQEQLAAGAEAPVVIIAHSLGCAIASNYLWDAQQHTAWACGDTPLTRGETVASLVTMGCNLPLLSLALPPSELRAVTVPGAGAERAFRNKREFRRHAGWFNFYDPDDLLGFPLKLMSHSYQDAVRADIAVNTGPIWAAHTGYWTDNEVTIRVARRLVWLLSAV